MVPVLLTRMTKIRQKFTFYSPPQKQQEEMGKMMQEFGNPLAGCLPLLLQMPILFALFATLRGSPFADINYTVDVQVFPQEQMERIIPQPYTTKSQNVFVSDGVHEKITAILPSGNRLAVGETEKIELQTAEGKSLESLVAQYSDSNLQPRWEITKGQERISISENGEIQAFRSRSHWNPGKGRLLLLIRSLS